MFIHGAKMLIRTKKMRENAPH